MCQLKQAKCEAILKAAEVLKLLSDEWLSVELDTALEQLRESVNKLRDVAYEEYISQ